jgi:hypothetical protein
MQAERAARRPGHSESEPSAGFRSDPPQGPSHEVPSPWGTVELTPHCRKIRSGLRRVRDRGSLAQPLPLTGMKWKTRDDWLLVTSAQPGEESPAPKLTTPSKSPIGAT